MEHSRWGALAPNIYGSIFIVGPTHLLLFPMSLFPLFQPWPYFMLPFVVTLVSSQRQEEKKSTAVYGCMPVKSQGKSVCDIIFRTSYNDVSLGRDFFKSFVLDIFCVCYLSNFPYLVLK